MQFFNIEKLKNHRTINCTKKDLSKYQVLYKNVKEMIFFFLQNRYWYNFEYCSSKYEWWNSAQKCLRNTRVFNKHVRTGLKNNV